MAFNGSGTYTLPAGNPVVTGTTISSSTTNTTNSDIATALTNCITRDGQSTPSANLPMNAKKLTGLAAGTSAGDSVRYEQITGLLPLSGGIMTGAITFVAGQTIANLAAGSAGTIPYQSASGTTAMLSAGTSGQVLISNGAAAPSWVTFSGASLVRSARTTNTILASADNSVLIDITSGTFSQTFTAAATLGSGWYCYIRNSGTGTITLDPNASELIDGATTLIMRPNDVRIVQCTGSDFNTVRIDAGIGNSGVFVKYGNGKGSTNTAIRRWTTTKLNVGTAITYADSATLGAKFTINEAGIYAITYTENTTGANVWIGITLNGTSLATPPWDAPEAEQLNITQTGSGGNSAQSTSIVASFAVGDIVRAQVDPGGTFGTSNDTSFYIRKIAYV